MELKLDVRRMPGMKIHAKTAAEFGVLLVPGMEAATILRFHVENWDGREDHQITPRSTR